jgi:hypothetical protein
MVRRFFFCVAKSGARTCLLWKISPTQAQPLSPLFCVKKKIAGWTEENLILRLENRLVAFNFTVLNESEELFFADKFNRHANFRDHYAIDLEAFYAWSFMFCL